MASYPEVTGPSSKRKSTMSINCPSGSGKVKGYAVGDKVKLTIEGKVCSVRADEYDENLQVDVTSVQGHEPTSITRAIKNRKMATGRFA